MSSRQQSRIYLDYNATSPLAAGVADAVASALSLSGNPSSPHAEGRKAAACLASAREAVADAIGVEALDLVFSSGGTESNHLGLVGLATSLPAGSPIWLPKVVHPSLWAAGEHLAARGYPLHELAVDREGRVLVEALEEALRDEAPGVVGISWVNHELGTIEEVAAIATRVRAHGSYLHVDAVQALGKIPIDASVCGAHSIALSAHKIGGPKGVGALWVTPGPDLAPLVGGGKQESGRRPGTQALPAIAGFAAALRALPERLAKMPHLRSLERRLREGLLSLGAELLSPADGVGNTVCARFENLPGDMLVSGLDLKGVAISTGAACSSGTTLPSPGLLAIGLDSERAKQAIRISLGPANGAEDVEVLLELLPPILERAKRFS